MKKTQLVVINSNCVLPQAPACLSQAASSAIQSRRRWQARLHLTPLCSFEQTEGGSQGGGRKRRGCSKGRWGRGARGWLPVILWAGALDSPLPIMGCGWVPILGAVPWVRGTRGEGVPALVANMGRRAHLLLPWRAVSNVSVIHLEQKREKLKAMRPNHLTNWSVAPVMEHFTSCEPSLFLT